VRTRPDRGLPRQRRQRPLGAAGDAARHHSRRRGDAAPAPALAAKFAKGPALALAAAKAAIDGGLDGDLANGLRLESHLFASLFATEDRTIGMRSFIEQGPGKAVFVGTEPAG
jgi:enoyl-CoA hydratase/carnithine racemase